MVELCAPPAVDEVHECTRELDLVYRRESLVYRDKYIRSPGPERMRTEARNRSRFSVSFGRREGAGLVLQRVGVMHAKRFLI